MAVGTWLSMPLRVYAEILCESQKHKDEVPPEASHVEIFYDSDNEDIKFARLVWFTCDECHRKLEASWSFMRIQNRET